MGESSRQIADLLEQVLSVFDGVVFGALAFVGFAAWLRRRDAASAWFAGMFASLEFVVVVGLFTEDDAGDSLLGRVTLAVLALMPFCLYRFTRSFTGGITAVDVLSTALTLTVVGWSLAIPVQPEGAERSDAFLGFLVVFLAHWTILSFASAWYFLAEARSADGVAARRMRLFGGASLALATALLLAGVAGGQPDSLEHLVVNAAVQLVGAASALLFWFALAPPRALRAAWRAREFEAMQGGLRELVQGETVVDVHERTLAAARRLTGGVAAVLLDDERKVVAWDGVDLPEAERICRAATATDADARDQGRVLNVDRLVVTAGPAAPFFGAEELRLLETVSAFSRLAEERATTLARERDANERLRQVDQLKTEFVAMVAHDLRSPMSIITGFADTIHDRWDVLSDADKKAYLRLISRNTRSLADFVEDVLQVARMESGELHYEMQPFDPRSVVERMITDMQSAHPGLTLTVHAPAHLPRALGDEERNWQILNNLVSNAVKFSEGAPQVEVEIRELPEESAVSIAVRDNGVGIATEDIPRLFRRFSRIGQSRRDAPGTGLGLYIVKSMVEAQGGRIWVQSTPGEGSTFTYTLPVAGEGTAA